MMVEIIGTRRMRRPASAFMVIELSPSEPWHIGDPRATGLAQIDDRKSFFNRHFVNPRGLGGSNASTGTGEHCRIVSGDGDVASRNRSKAADFAIGCSLVFHARDVGMIKHPGFQEFGLRIEQGGDSFACGEGSTGLDAIDFGSSAEFEGFSFAALEFVEGAIV